MLSAVYEQKPQGAFLRACVKFTNFDFELCAHQDITLWYNHLILLQVFTYKYVSAEMEEPDLKNMTIARAAEVSGGKLCGNVTDINRELGKVVIDSRAVADGDLFAAYKGEHVDGHAYIGVAFDNGAACCLAQRVPEGETRPVLVVDDVQTALEKIAAEYRKSLDIPVIGITGSVGKTSAKEMISAVLSEKMNVLKTDKNLNNQIGVPMTLSRITPEHEAAVIELGISKIGDMAALAAMAVPTIAVYTVIGHAHLEYLHDLDGVLKEKTEMLNYMAADSIVIMNGDDEKLRGFSCRQKKILYGLSDGCDIKAENVVMPDAGHTECDIIYDDRKIHAVIPAYGQHMVYAALEGAAVGFVMGMSDEEIARGIANFEVVGRRGAVTDTGFITLIDDCYNANPDSMKCGIDSIAKLEGRRVCILSDMLEQGEESPAMHRDVGEYAAEKGIDLVITTGELSKNICAGAGEHGIHFENNAAIIEALPSLIKAGDIVLVKASRGMHLEEISEALKKLTDERPIVMMDLDDTIFDFHKAERIAIAETFRRVGIDPKEENLNLYSEFNAQCWRKLETGEFTRIQVLTHRFEMLFEAIGIEGDAFATQKIYETLLKIGHYYIPGAPELLDALYGKYRLFLVSNGTAETQDSRLASANISHYFENIFISQRIGFEKPTKEFFAECEKRIPNYSADRAMIIGDSLTSDIRGGINAGIRTCWFNPGHKAPNAPVVPDFEIDSLADFPALLERSF